MPESSKSQSWIALARVVEAWGLEGWIRVQAYGDPKASVLGRARSWRFRCTPPSKAHPPALNNLLSTGGTSPPAADQATGVLTTRRHRAAPGRKTPPQGRSESAAANATRDSLDLQILKLRAHGDCWLALPESIDNRDKALALKGCEILLRRTDFPRTVKGEYYWVDLIGCDVINRMGEKLGRVEALQDHGAHPLLCVLPSAGPGTLGPNPEADASPPPHYLLIPFVKHFVDRVDLAQASIHVDWQADWS